jgi:hypothetical protein
LAADRAEFTAEEDRSRDAYATLLVTSRAALRNFRMLRLAFAAGAPDVAEVREAFSHANELASAMSQAAAVAELLGSGRPREKARPIYEKARACADMYQEHSIGMAGLEKALGALPPGRFDPDRAKQLCDVLAAAIEAFADSAHDELAVVTVRG